MITWGLLSAGMMFVQSPLQFYVLRFLLGVAEAGFYPGVIYYFSGWFPPCHRGGRSAASTSPARSLRSSWAAISGWLLALDGVGRLHGWQWLFLVQGLPSVLVGLLVLRCLPDSPATVAWLDAAGEGLDTTRAGARAGARSANRSGITCSPRFAIRGFCCWGRSGSCSSARSRRSSSRRRWCWRTPRASTRGHVGYLVSLGGIIGAVAMLLAGDYADRRGDRFLNAFWCTVVLAGAFLVIAFAPTPARHRGRLSGICRNLLHDPDADVVGMGGGAACARAGRRRRCNQYPVADRRIRHAVCMGRGEGRDGQLPGRAECAVA